jgi:uncharacterized membrane protein YphA (DoxX/SURF4 family)
MLSLRSIRETGSQRWLLAPRLIAALPLVGVGSAHLIGVTPMMEILKRAAIPFPTVNYFLAPIIMVIAGASLGTGYFARIGAALGAVAMLVAIYSKLVIEVWLSADRRAIERQGSPANQ